ncbi:acyltransferase family protein (macronuclear) [Tetrahymena thermophila SB210]|uniref:Acyltransferase family protein n=1 Tax=Tetrahymena thermophila (strain SB210) TaxID=312017 RepID=Q235E7_TETTS|nr:acyltransferase family protein [Tetrahymena thermophila SB210]EAR92156.2 acyltransferase family protein [Tetrahymena thermophila SB210]|eukprot:XP_001012401.2 acyltransferase family protein [Tetrahymena thermophila SB210]
MNSCLIYYGELISEVAQGKSFTDPTKIAYVNYSGSTLNQQGDVAACLRTPQMNFVELKLYFPGVTFFEGICIKDICSAKALISIKKEFAYLLSLVFQTQITPDQFDFVQYPVEKPSTDNYGFIIISLILAFILLLTLISFFMVNFKSKSKDRNKSNSESKDSNAKSHLINKNQIQDYLKLEDEKLNEELEGNLEEKKTLNEGQKKLENENESIFMRIINCWNLKSNLQKTFNVTVRNSDLAAFDCIRTLSFLQVMLGHCFLICISYYSNFNDFDIVQKEPFTLFILGCFYSVDVFFMLGGFFLAYVIADPKIQQSFKVKNFLKMIISYFIAILNRLSRILPTYFIALYVIWQYLSQIGQSPTWSEIEFFSGLCDENKLKKMLFIDNLYDEPISCLPWTWYLSNDMQMFVLSLILMIVYANNKTAGKLLIFSALGAFIGLAIYLSYDYEILIVSQLTPMLNPHWNDIYFKPWCRIPPYLLGLLFGIFYKEYQIEKQQNDSSKKVSFLMKISHYMRETFVKWMSYSLGLAIIFYLIFGPRPLQVNGVDYWNQNTQHFVYGISRVLYSLAVILVLLPSVCGSKDLIVKIMSSSIFQFMSKLTFQGYLYHYAIETYSLWSFYDSMYLSIQNVLNIYVAQVPIIFLISFIFYVLIELPFNNLANIFFNRNSKKKQIEKEENDKQKAQHQGIN